MSKGVRIYSVGPSGNQTAEVLLSDGMTRVQTLGWKDGSAGICIVREQGLDIKPFTEFDAPKHKSADTVDENKIIIRADNEKSIRAVIKRLEEAVKFLG